ncbi:winged helix-turn-helix domain-containing protein [Paludibaculum fermentans]|uniref:winged helix-turn-helix domain-containing protein n=1 Tax=Paludibaculum fermentans TaxID=1473598 RepID=UPI003EC1215A
MLVESLSYQFDDVVIETRGHRLLRGGAALEVEPKAFRVLVYLVENRGRAVTKDELVQAVWAGTFVSDNALTRVIAQLRKQLGDTARDSRVIETVPTIGYRFLPEVRTVSETPVVPVKRMNRRVLFYLAAIPLLGLFWWLRREQAAPLPPQMMQLTTSTGVDICPSFSPDGRSIAYSSDRSGRFEIYVRPLAQGGRELQVTSDGMQNLQPSWSPDGQYLAFTSQRRGGIGVVPALGGVARMVTDFGSRPAWSPDGHEIAFQSEGVFSLSPLDLLPSGASTIWVVGAQGGAARQLTGLNSAPGAHSNPLWMPEGAILFVSTTRVSWPELWSIGARGGSASRVKLPVPMLGATAYAAGSRTLYYVGHGKQDWVSIIKVGLSGGGTVGEARRVTATLAGTMPRDLAASRDGSALAISVSKLTTSLSEIPAGGGEPKVLMQDTSFRNSFPVFSPDGSKIAYFSRRFGEPGDFWLMDADGRNARQVTTLPPGERMPSWTPDGKELATLCKDEGGFSMCFTSLEGVLRKVPVEGQPNAWARLSPDGRSVVTQRTGEGGRKSIWVQDLAGGAARQISPKDASIGFPLWAPDGRWVVGEVHQGENTNLVMVPVEGGAPVVLTEGRGHAWPAGWAPDGDRVVYAGFRDGVWNLYWTSRTSKETRRLSDNRSLAVYVRYPTWSPISDRIVFERGEVRSNIFLLQER